MIEFTKAFKCSDGTTVATLEDAQRHELELLFKNESEQAARIATLLMENSEKVVDVLTTSATSKPRARKINGGTKTRKAKPTPPAPTEAV